MHPRSGVLLLALLVAGCSSTATEDPGAQTDNANVNQVTFVAKPGMH